jgi:hypothetical protein
MGVKLDLPTYGSDENILFYGKVSDRKLEESSSVIIRVINLSRTRWAGHVARIGEFRNAWKFLIGKPEGKTPVGKPRRKCKENIKRDLKEIGRENVVLIRLVQDRAQWRAFVDTFMKLWVS